MVAKSANIKRTVLAVTLDPRVPNLSKVSTKHWISIVFEDPYLREVFPQPPLLAYKRQHNLSDFLIRAKLLPKERKYTKRKANGMKKCGKNCLICPYIRERKTLEGKGFTWTIKDEVNCKTKNIVTTGLSATHQNAKKFI